MLSAAQGLVRAWCTTVGFGVKGLIGYSRPQHAYAEQSNLPSHEGGSEITEQQHRSDINQPSFSLAYKRIGEPSREDPQYAEGIEQNSNAPVEASEDDTPVRAARS